MTSRSDRSTGQYRAYRGSGCVGIIPSTKPGNPYKERRRTKPLRRPVGHKPHLDQQVVRGRRAQVALIERTRTTIRPTPLATAVRRVLSGAFK